MKFLEEHLILKETVRKRMEADDIKEMIKKYERHDAPFPWEFVHEMAKLGLCGINIPEEYGGAGMDNVSGVIAMMEMSKIWAGGALILAVGNSLVSYPLVKYGSPHHKEMWLRDLASGNILGCFALTESDHGSDAAYIQTSAKIISKGFSVNGAKHFITNAPVASFFILFARTDPDSRDHRGISAFAVPAREEGLVCEPMDEKAGLHAAKMCTVRFTDYFASFDSLLWRYNDGFRVAMDTLKHGRLWIAAQAIGLMERAAKLALDYTKGRKTFGEFLIYRSSIADAIDNLNFVSDVSKVLLFYAAKLEDEKKDFGVYASLAKFYSTEELENLIWKAKNIFGGSGFLKAMEIERLVRDSWPLTVYEGASNVQRDRILKAWLGDKLQVYPPPPLTYLLANLKDGVRQRLSENDLLKVKNQRYASRVADILPLVAAWDIFQKEFSARGGSAFGGKKEWPHEFMIFQDPKIFEERLLEELRLRWPYDELMPKDAVFDKTHEHLLGCGQKGI